MSKPFPPDDDLGPEMTPEEAFSRAMLDNTINDRSWPKAAVETSRPAPSAQIPASAANAPGFSLGFWRRSGDRVADGVS